MIESIAIKKTATYAEEQQLLNDLSTFNYCFGPNGSGKTTISRIIANQDEYPSCDVRWRGDRRLQTMVYNLDFIERNFVQSAELKGVFTLGESQVETLDRIAQTRSELERLAAKQESLAGSLNGSKGKRGKRDELKAVEDELKAKCWAQKKRHDKTFSAAFAGARNSGDRFKARVMEERAKVSAAPPALDDLIQRAGTVFGPAPVHEPLLPALDCSDLLGYETDSLPQRRVVGREDAGIAGMIQHLGNSDWVRRGRAYLKDSSGACPFCQQTLPTSFSEELESYFDQSYRKAAQEIDHLARGYDAAAERLQSEIARRIERPPRFLDVEMLCRVRDHLRATVRLNQERLMAKRHAPSESFALESISSLAAELQEIVEAANTRATEHNRRVSNLEVERASLRDQIWQHIVQIELVDALADYDRRTAEIAKAVEALERRLAEVKAETARRTRELHALERSTTSIEPAISGINALLESVGFTGFSIQQAEPRNSYKLVREDGTDAKETLSEGERSFVTFLYFYHLIRGSSSESGVSTDRVVVFDDPVSSLDSDVLFIVSSLIKGLFEEIRKDTGPMKQVFVFTHNVYFHREVTFNPRRRDMAMREETFWVVRKVGARSTVVRYPNNPVRTSYDLLWEEVRNPTRSRVTIQNTLRRILENYFTILGNVDHGTIIKVFEGRDRAICQSLFSWVNAGSHFAFDDLYVAATDSVDSYLRVFRQVFERSGQEGHYRMMMGDAYQEESEPARGQQAPGIRAKR